MVFPSQLENTNKLWSLNKFYSVYLLSGVRCPMILLPLTVSHMVMVLGSTVKYGGGSGIFAAGGPGDLVQTDKIMNKYQGISDQKLVKGG